jgi:hypothetical protein
MLTWPCRAKFKEREYYSIDPGFSSSIFTIFALREKHRRTGIYSLHNGRIPTKPPGSQHRDIGVKS